MPCSKQTYYSIGAAEARADELARKWNKARPLLAYECQQCGLYHLTSNGDNGRRLNDSTIDAHDLERIDFYHRHHKKLLNWAKTRSVKDRRHAR